MEKGSNSRSVRKQNPGISSDEAHEDLIDFKRTKQSVNELLHYRKLLSEAGIKDPDKINDIRRQAIDAINHLFKDMKDEKDNNSA